MLENLVAHVPQSQRERCLRWMSFMENEVDFWPFGGLIHQKSHWARVLVLALTIGVHEGFSDADLDALAMAAAFHDTRRKDSWLDIEHGHRAAEHYRAFCAETGLPYDPRTELAVRWHAQNDDVGRPVVRQWDADHEQCFGWNATVLDVYKAFKDSDGLDRLRLNADALDVRYLRFDYSKTLTGFEQQLLVASRESGTWEDTAFSKPPRYLVVVDAQRDLVRDAGPEHSGFAEDLADKIRGFDGHVVFTKLTRSPIAPDGSPNTGACLCGTQGWQLATEHLRRLQAQHDCAVYLKGGFGSPDLARDLEMAAAWRPIECVEFAGLHTDTSIIATIMLVQAKLPRTRIVADEALCIGTTPVAHASALQLLGSCGVEVR